jgi:hypothetical protein
MEGGVPQRQFQVLIAISWCWARAWSGTASSFGRCTSCSRLPRWMR